MNDLACGVKTCVYNERNECKKNSIKVDGSMAKNSSSTYCSSFSSDKKDKVSSSCNCEPKRETDILCDVVNCRYNDDKKCSAKHVDVTGSHAAISSETECATFISK